MTATFPRINSAFFLHISCQTHYLVSYFCYLVLLHCFVGLSVGDFFYFEWLLFRATSSEESVLLSDCEGHQNVTPCQLTLSHRCQFTSVFTSAVRSEAERKLSEILPSVNFIQTGGGITMQYSRLGEAV